MSRQIRFWSVCSILAVGFLAPGLSYGQENPGVNPAPAATIVESEAPADASVPQDITLEDLERLLEPQKPHNVCGVPCGPGLPKCRVSCGGAAVCDFGVCHPLP